MKILNLILYSLNDEIYLSMYHTLSSYLKKQNIKDFTYFFYCYDDISTDVEIKDDIILLRGKEKVKWGTITKTMKVLQFVENWDYDLIVRTNISTIIDWKKFLPLLNRLNTNEIIYGAGYVFLWEEDEYKITFGAGTSIVLSRPTINLLVRSTLNERFFDDVSIGLFLYPKYVKEIINFKDYYAFNSEYSDKILIFRNKSDDRGEDAERMKRICERIIEREEFIFQKSYHNQIKKLFNHKLKSFPRLKNFEN